MGTPTDRAANEGPNTNSKIEHLAHSHPLLRAVLTCVAHSPIEAASENEASGPAVPISGVGGFAGKSGVSKCTERVWRVSLRNQCATPWPRPVVIPVR